MTTKLSKQLVERIYRVDIIIGELYPVDTVSYGTVSPIVAIKYQGKVAAIYKRHVDGTKTKTLVYVGNVTGGEVIELSNLSQTERALVFEALRTYARGFYEHKEGVPEVHLKGNVILFRNSDGNIIDAVTNPGELLGYSE